MKNKEGLRFTTSTKGEPSTDTLMTSSTATTNNKNTTPHRSNSDPVPLADDGVVFHNGNSADCYKCACVYWRHGSLPENGRMYINAESVSFKGILSTKLSFNLDDDFDLQTKSRMGGLVKDAFTISVGGGEKFLFSTVLKDRKTLVDKITFAMANVKLRKEEEQFDAISGRGDSKKKRNKEKKFRMADDTTLSKMNIIAERKLKGVSLQDYFDVAWSEGHNCDKKPMYGPFLEKQGKNNVTVGSWEEVDFVGDWCEEKYTNKRIVTFDFLKQTIGKTLVEVKHTQQSRRLGNDQFIVQIKMEMKGFPYSDCFVVQVRHVASRVGDNDLSIQIGMFVKFMKSCMFESKIKTNTGSETTKAQLALLEDILEECASFATQAEGSEDDDDHSEEDEEEDTKEEAVVAIAPTRRPLQLPDPLFKMLRMLSIICITFFHSCLTTLRRYVQPELFDPIPNASVDEALADTRTRVKLLEDISLKSVSERRKKDISREITLIEKSLTRIEKMSTRGL